MTARAVTLCAVTGGPANRIDALGKRWRDSPTGALYRRSVQLELGIHSLALAAQHVLCAAPFLVAMSALARQWGLGDVGHLLSDTMGLRGDAQHELMALFIARTHETTSTFVIGFLVAFTFATGVSASMQRTFERIWDLPHAGLATMWRHLLWALMTTALFAFALWINKATHRWRISSLAEVCLESASTGAAALFYYWWTQRVLLIGRIPWRKLFPGAVLIGLGTTLMVVVVQLIAPAQVTQQVADYGLVGAAFLLSTILVSFSTIVLWGAFIGCEWIRRRERSNPR